MVRWPDHSRPSRIPTTLARDRFASTPAPTGPSPPRRPCRDSSSISCAAKRTAMPSLPITFSSCFAAPFPRVNLRGPFTPRAGARRTARPLAARRPRPGAGRAIPKSVSRSNVSCSASASVCATARDDRRNLTIACCVAITWRVLPALRQRLWRLSVVWFCAARRCCPCSSPGQRACACTSPAPPLTPTPIAGNAASAHYCGRDRAGVGLCSSLSGPLRADRQQSSRQPLVCDETVSNLIAEWPAPPVRQTIPSRVAHSLSDPPTASPSTRPAPDPSEFAACASARGLSARDCANHRSSALIVGYAGGAAAGFLVGRFRPDARTPYGGRPEKNSSSPRPSLAVSASARCPTSRALCARSSQRDSVRQRVAEWQGTPHEAGVDVIAHARLTTAGPTSAVLLAPACPIVTRPCASPARVTTNPVATPQRLAVHHRSSNHQELAMPARSSLHSTAVDPPAPCTPRAGWGRLAHRAGARHQPGIRCEHTLARVRASPDPRRRPAPSPRLPSHLRTGRRLAQARGTAACPSSSIRLSARSRRRPKRATASPAKLPRAGSEPASDKRIVFIEIGPGCTKDHLSAPATAGRAGARRSVTRHLCARGLSLRASSRSTSTPSTLSSAGPRPPRRQRPLSPAIAISAPLRQAGRRACPPPRPADARATPAAQIGRRLGAPQRGHRPAFARPGSRPLVAFAARSQRAIAEHSIGRPDTSAGHRSRLGTS